MSKVTITPGCYVDGVKPYTEFEIILILQSLMRDWNPKHKINEEVFSSESIGEFGSEIITDLTKAINESIGEKQIAEWEAGDLIIREQDTE